MDTLKKALLKLVGFGENLEVALKDHRLSLMEYATLGSGLGLAVFFIIQNYKEIDSELDTLDDAGEAELKEYIRVELDLSNDRAEGIFEKTFGLLLSVVAYIKALIKK